MVLRGVGAGLIARLMRAERRGGELETDWLLFGPSDAEVVEAEPGPAPPPALLAAE